MVRLRVLVVAFVAALGTLGVPTHATSASAPNARDASLPVARTVKPGHHTDLVVRAPFSINMVGVSFVGADPDARGVEVLVRARAGGAWGKWVDTHVEPDEGPDAEEARAAAKRAFTSPVFVGRADAVRVRVELDRDATSIGDVRAHAINTLGEPAGGVRAMLGAVGRFLTSTASRPAQAHAPRPTIISRKGWGADESLRSSGPGATSRLRAAFIHHTANSNSYSKSESAAVVRAIYRYHTKGRGYSDIAYNFLVDRYGQIFEGRAGGVDRAVIGAHTMGFNTYTTGVAVIGTFSNATPPSAVMTSLKKLLAWKMDVHHVKPVGKVTLVSGGNNKYDKGERVSFHRIAGHRNATQTSCPGYQLYRRLPGLRDAVDKYGRPKIYFPIADRTTLRPDGDGRDETVTIQSWFSQRVDWAVRFIDSSGTVRRKISGNGYSLSKTWNGTAGGLPVPTGRYVWRITARSSSGHAARPAEGVVYVVNRHPTGTLLEDVAGLFAVAGNQIYEVDEIMRRSRFGDLPAVRTGAREREWYGAAPAPSLRQGTLLVADGSRYIFSAGALRKFASHGGVDTFSALGYDEAALIPADLSFVRSLPSGSPVNDVTRHPAGTVVRDPATGREWFIEEEARRPITRLARASRFEESEVVPAVEGDLLLPAHEDRPLSVRRGALIRDNHGGRPWIADGRGRRQFVTWRLFTRMGYTTDMLIVASDADLATLPVRRAFG